MKTKILKKLILGLAIIYAPLQSMAWGVQGHRIVGQIAESYLTPKARKALQAILGDESLAIAGNYADFIRSDPKYNYTTPWHYVDFEKAYSQPEMDAFLKADTNVDAYTKLEFLIGDIKKEGLSKDKKLFDLKMLIHLIEDLHQPMHTASADNKGGNDIKLNWFSSPTNLHTIWDSQLINFQELSYTEYTANINHTTEEQRAEWQKAPISQWVYESNQIALKIYSEIKPGDTLSYNYNFSHIAILNQQLVKAGVRLAGVLNSIFG